MTKKIGTPGNMRIPTLKAMAWIPYILKAVIVCTIATCEAASSRIRSKLLIRQSSAAAAASVLMAVLTPIGDLAVAIAADEALCARWRKRPCRRDHGAQPPRAVTPGVRDARAKSAKDAQALAG